MCNFMGLASVYPSNECAKHNVTFLLKVIKQDRIYLNLPRISEGIGCISHIDPETE